MSVIVASKQNFSEHKVPVPEGRGIVFGGVDDVIINNGSQSDVREAVNYCLDDARVKGAPFILSQTSTPFSDLLNESARENFMLFMKLGTKG